MGLLDRRMGKPVRLPQGGTRGGLFVIKIIVKYMQADQAIYKNSTVLIVLLFLILGGFYWFQYRPYTIRTGCYNKTMAIIAPGGGSERTDGYFGSGAGQDIYNDCIASHGL
jgi:hypothetical protein